MSFARNLFIGSVLGLTKRPNRIKLVVRPIGNFRRLLSSPSTTGEECDHSKSRQLRFSVDKFCELSVKGVSLCNFDIGCLNPERYPDQNTAIVNVPTDVGLKNLKIDYKDSVLSVQRTRELIEALEIKELPTCNIEIPIKTNVEIRVEGKSNVSITNLQNDRLMVASESGNCVVSNIQSVGMSITTAGGHIECEGLLHGNAFLKTQQKGKITVNKVLCQHIDFITDDGTVDVKSLYSVQSKFSTNTGNVNIGNGHGCIGVDIKDHGRLTIDSLDGSLSAFVNKGDIEVFVCRQNGIDIDVQSGDIILKLQEQDARLDLKGNSLEIDETIEFSDFSRSSVDGLNCFSGLMLSERSRAVEPGAFTIQAHTKDGSVKVQMMDWIDSLKLNAAFKDEDSI